MPFFFWQLTVDEGGYAYTARWWFRGVPLYSNQLWLDRFQGIFLAYRLGALLLGKATWGIRLWGALWAAGTTLAIYWLLRRLFDRQAALIASLLFAVFSAAPHIEGFTANGETFMILPATLSAYFVLTRKPFWAGLMASLAVMLKPSGAVGLLLAAAWLGYTRASWREWLRLGAGALAPVLLSVGHGALTVGLGPYLYAVGFFELGVGWGPHTDLIVEAVRGWVSTAPVWAPLAVLAIPGLAKASRTPRLFLLCWLFSSLAGVAMGGRWYQHYFIQLLPALSACAGIGLVYLWRTGKLRIRCESLALVLSCFLLFEGPLFLQEPSQGMWTLYRRPGYQMSHDVASYIRTHTRDDETIYVAFAQANIYYEARRRSAYPYLYFIHVVYLPRAYDRLVETIEARVPVYVLGLDPPVAQVDPEGRFQRALERGYRVEAVFDGVPLYRRR